MVKRPMPSSKCLNLATAVIASFLTLAAFCPASLAQGPLSEAPVPNRSVEPVSPLVIPPQPPEYSHKFWDGQNKALFVVAGAFNGADFALTRSNLQSGGRELNPVVRVFGRSTPALAVNFAGETAGVIALSYFFHKTGHHKLERLTSVINIGASAGAVSYGLAAR